MSLPEPASTLRAPTLAEQPWWWRLEDAAGAEVQAPDEHAGQRFASQADAESWIGEIWSGLAEHGVAAVTLFEVEREVYGPMSLSA
ncbi:MAG: hypothetical protein LH468_03460 [Nocardioides sp.]|nr:hypothetical protein [Nocardioides sp.]